MQFISCSVSLICQEGKTCLFKSIMFCSCGLVRSFVIFINTNKYIEIMFFLIFSKLLSCLQLRQGEREKKTQFGDYLWIICYVLLIYGLFNQNMIIRCVFVTGRRRRRRRRRKGTYIQPPEGRASSPSEGGFMKGGLGRMGIIGCLS